ncbi:MAG: hypothetical protein KDI46_02575 [Alphaproteobacteria bacterium]|nr:hypothetical protein [Alphaproteobacteria bacterium]
MTQAPFPWNLPDGLAAAFFDAAESLQKSGCRVRGQPVTSREDAYFVLRKAYIEAGGNWKSVRDGLRTLNRVCRQLHIPLAAPYAESR